MQNEDYYEVRPVTGGTRIPNDSGRAQFNNWIGDMPIELSNLRADDLLKNAPAAGHRRP